ncbi:hypothetical protein HNR46_001794 [Haloferula luteola]|uniref:PA14 domain-containing protein n=1 Tax=Haloferula luteola TaxID=595692 RepID=A0A840UZL9_9BACT|nr:hypothetical protein [Haloferula luteola]MBB5351557.1 hypothetical protein [Haloferula luteola]
MSLHVQSTPEAEAHLQSDLRKSKIASLIVALLSLLLLGISLALILVPPLIKETPVLITYVPPVREIQKFEEKPKIHPLHSSPSAPSAVSSPVIAAHAMSALAIPVPERDFGGPTPDFGAFDCLGNDWAHGGIESTGGEGLGSGGMFGHLVGPGLIGTYYDLKVTRDGQPSEMALQDFEEDDLFRRDYMEHQVNQTYSDTLREAISQKLPKSSFERYFRAPSHLRITQLSIHQILADEAPKAFRVEEKVRGRRWVIIYRGTVTPPVSGRYRFVGFADDELIVMARSQVLLDGGLQSPLPDASERTFYHQEHLGGTWPSYEGTWFDVTAGEELDLTILTGERPGGNFSCYLLIEKDGEDYAPDESGARKLPLFKMAPSSAPPRGVALPDLAPDTSWSIWPGRE